MPKEKCSGAGGSAGHQPIRRPSPSPLLRPPLPRGGRVHVTHRNRAAMGGTARTRRGGISPGIQRHRSGAAPLVLRGLAAPAVSLSRIEAVPETRRDARSASGGNPAAVSGGGTARPGLTRGGQAELGSEDAPDKRRAARGLALCEGLSQLLSHGRETERALGPKGSAPVDPQLGRTRPSEIRCHAPNITAFARAGPLQIRSPGKKIPFGVPRGSF